MKSFPVGEFGNGVKISWSWVFWGQTRLGEYKQNVSQVRQTRIRRFAIWVTVRDRSCLARA